ncbi:site-specific integrase [Bacillus sp. BRMEA1]|uniref:site-specific integrase n=1 Tax=Neobacillus endophyticus TaxID=2738405 RepID=UPI0015658353|nr:site-specific integrase [Neobacillus endophyticus]NRD80213.1 site-specific integrase [Neobacillus endophyticus]
MAHIRKRNNTYEYRIYLPKDPLNGKRREITKGGFKSKSEAKAEALQIEWELENGTYLSESNVTFAEVVEEWLDAYRDSGVKLGTIQNKINIVNSHFLPVWGTYPIQKISNKMFDQRMNDLAKRHELSTLRGIKIVANLIFKYALKYKIIKTDPTVGYEYPKEQTTVEDLENDEGPVIFLEKEELYKFLESAYYYGDYIDYPLFSTKALTGVRIGELRALRWSDVDFMTLKLRITKSMYDKGKTGNYIINTPKNGKARTIDISEELVGILQKHKNEQDKIKAQNHRVFKDEEFIFCDDNGYPVSYKTVWGHLNKLIKVAGIDKPITPHCLRHTHASLCIEAGADYKYIQERLGHGDITITMKTYGHMTKGLESKESVKVFKLLECVIPDCSGELNSYYYNRVQVAEVLNVGQTTVGEWSIALEKSGWEFKTIHYKGKDKRLYKMEDLNIFTNMKSLLAENRNMKIKEAADIVVLQAVKMPSEHFMVNAEKDGGIDSRTFGHIIKLKEIIQKTSQEIANVKFFHDEIDHLNELLMLVENKIKDIVENYRHDEIV